MNDILNFKKMITPTIIQGLFILGSLGMVIYGFGMMKFNFLMGLGLHVAVDWQKINDKNVTPTLALLENKPMTLGIGLHYTFRLPGLPGVPMVPGI